MKMIYTRYDRRKKEERKAIEDFFKPLNAKTMSIWDNPDLEPDNSGSKYISSALGDDGSIELTFTALHHQEQPENSMYPTKDGKVWNFYFTDAEGDEKVLSQNSTNSLFFKEAREKKMEVGDKVRITKKGSGTDTTWTIDKLDGSSETFTPPTPPKEDTPF